MPSSDPRRRSFVVGHLLPVAACQFIAAWRPYTIQLTQVWWIMSKYYPRTHIPLVFRPQVVNISNTWIFTSHRIVFPSTLASGASAYYVMCVAWLKIFLAKILDFLLWKLWQFVVVAGHNSHDFFKLPIYSQRPPKSILSSAPKKRNQWISQQNKLLGPKAATDHLDLCPQHYGSHKFYKITFAFKFTQNMLP